MKKTSNNQFSPARKKLTLGKETVTMLADKHLAGVAGGGPETTILDWCDPGNYQTNEYSICVC